jgi:hypothetical protein
MYDDADEFPGDTQMALWPTDPDDDPNFYMVMHDFDPYFEGFTDEYGKEKFIEQN